MVVSGDGVLADLCPPPPLPEPDETQVTLKLDVAGVPASDSAEVCALSEPFLVTMST